MENSCFSFSPFPTTTTIVSDVFNSLLECCKGGAKQCDQSCTKFCHFGQILKDFGYSLRVCSVFGKILNLLWRNSFAIGQIFIVVNGQIIKSKIVIWPHWRRAAFFVFAPFHFVLYIQKQLFVVKNEKIFFRFSPTEYPLFPRLECPHHCWIIHWHGSNRFSRSSHWVRQEKWLIVW